MNVCKKFTRVPFNNNKKIIFQLVKKFRIISSVEKQKAFS